MALKDFANTLTGIYVDLLLMSTPSLFFVFLIIVEIRQFYIQHRSKAPTELTNAMDFPDNEPPNSSSDNSHHKTTVDLGTSSTIQKSKIELKKSRSASSVASQSSSHLSQSKQSEHSPKHVIIFSMSMYIAYTLSAWIFVFTTLENGIIGDCAGVGISGFLYMLGKCFLYLLFIYRLYFIYSYSVFQYNTKILLTIGIITAIWSVLVSTANLFMKRIVVLEVEGHSFCAIENNKLVMIGVIVYDLFINVLCCYFFY
eukprot:357059_1